jgi:hypothetical protein
VGSIGDAKPMSPTRRKKLSLAASNYWCYLQSNVLPEQWNLGYFILGEYT